MRRGGANPLGGSRSASTGHAHVEEGYRRLMLGRQSDGVRRVGRDRHQRQPGLVGDQISQCLSDCCVVVGDQDGHAIGHQQLPR